MKKILICFLLFAKVLFSQTTERVILVIIDGARYSETFGDFRAQYIPKMKEISQVGTIIDTMLNNGITVTKNAIPAIWCGSWIATVDTLYNGGNTQYTVVPTIWEYYRKHFKADMYQAQYIVKNLSNPWLPSFHSEYGLSYWPYYYLQGRNDIDVWNVAKQKLIEHKPVLSVIYLADVDAGGHTCNWNTYTTAITIADSIVGMIWDFIQSDPFYKDKTTMMVTNDHGRHADGVYSGFQSHGCSCWGCRRVMFLAAGKGIKKNVITGKLHSIIDIVPTISKMLNFPVPYVQGSSSSEIFETVSLKVEEVSTEKFSFELRQNYPNPFNPSTVIKYVLPSIQNIKLQVFDVLGRFVSTLMEGDQEAGVHEVRFDSKSISSGSYFVRLQANDFIKTIHIKVIK